MLLLRQRLLPYLYTLFEEAHRTGAPILRPLLFEFPEDKTTYTADDEFLLGSALLVAPIARPGVEYRHVYLPRGTWIHYWSGERFVGPVHVLTHAPLGQPPIYVRANTPLPLWPALEHDSPERADPLTWLVFVADADDGTASVYDDAGEGFTFENGDFARFTLTCSAGSSITLQLGPKEGSFTPHHSTMEFDIRGAAARPTQITANGVAINDWEYTDTRLLIRLPTTTVATEIEIA
jgi:alpha-glucosidase